MNNDGLFAAENLIDDAVITRAKLIETCKITCQWFQADNVKICGHPIDTFNNVAANRFSNRAKFREVLSRMRIGYIAVTPTQVVVLRSQTVRRAHLLPQPVSDAGAYHARIF